MGQLPHRHVAKYANRRPPRPDARTGLPADRGSGFPSLPPWSLSRHGAALGDGTATRARQLGAPQPYSCWRCCPDVVLGSRCPWRGSRQLFSLAASPFCPRTDACRPDVAWWYPCPGLGWNWTIQHWNFRFRYSRKHPSRGRVDPWLHRGLDDHAGWSKRRFPLLAFAAWCLWGGPPKRGDGGYYWTQWQYRWLSGDFIAVPDACFWCFGKTLREQQCRDPCRPPHRGQNSRFPTAWKPCPGAVEWLDWIDHHPGWCPAPQSPDAPGMARRKRASFGLAWRSPRPRGHQWSCG